MAATILVTDFAWPSLAVERDVLAGLDADLLVAETGEPDELVALAPQADAILVNWKQLPPEALDAAPRCLVVSRYGIGVDNIPVERATELGIVVANVPDFCVDEVSDHALALLLACSRKLATYSRSTRAGEWDVLAGRPIARLRGQLLGLVGNGSTARALGLKAQALGLRVAVYTPRLEPGHDELGFETTNDLHDLLARADFVSLHAPATDESRGMIGEPELRAMKESAYLVNVARGALVDESALVRALGEGWIAGAGLDVLAVEPPDAGNPLLSLENAIVTPHAAFYSEEAIADVARRAAENVAAVLRGELPESIVNPDVLERPAYRPAARAI